MKIMIIVAVVAALGGGASVAAERSDPGDLLYPVKVGVNERVVGGLNVGVESGAQYEARLIEKRLKEATRLSARGELTAEARQDISLRLNGHMERVHDHITALEARGDAHAAATVASDVESTLNAYARVFAEAQGEAAGELAAQLASQAAAVAQSRVEMETTVAAGTEASVEVAADGAREAARNTIQSMERVIAQTEGRVTVGSTAEAQAELRAAQQLVIDGEAQMEAGAYAEAFSTFQQAQRTAREARQILEVSVTSDSDITVGADGRMDAEDAGDSEENGEVLSDEESEGGGGNGLQIDAGANIEADATIGN